VSCAPPLPSSNRFSVLPIYDVSTPAHITEKDEDAQSKPIGAEADLTSRPPRKPKWERRMSPKLIIRSLEEGPNCLMIPTHLKTTDTMEEASTEAMVDTGATGDFIDQDFVARPNSRPGSCPSRFRCTM